MAYIGNTNTTQGFIPAVDYFNGDGATVAFTLSRPVASVAQVQAVIENVPQAPGDAYTVSGSTITFTSAPPLGTGNIYVYYTSPITQIVQPGQGTVGTVQIANGSVNNQKLDVASTDGTGAMYVPRGTTAQRPGSPASGYTRYNTTTGQLEIFNTIGGWVNAGTTGNTYTATYLSVAGGGGGGSSNSTNSGGGGGAGGFITSSTSVTPSIVYTITIGAGGAGSTSSGVNGSNGFNSVLSGTGITTVTSVGGGGGGDNQSGSSGGSGGGGGAGPSTRAGGAGTSGQGNAGGSGLYSGAYAGGGGGGAGNVGGNATSTNGGNGGNGSASSISGSSVTYAGGGGGGTSSGGGAGGTGGTGGGGTGGLGTSGATNGTANRGGGGGGVGFSPAGSGKNGGSGIVIISVPTANYSGITTGSPTVTTSGSNTIIQFNASGTYTA